MPAHRTERRLYWIVAAAAVAAGALAAAHYGSLGLTLSHYDAKAHLVVARRVFDNLTPGWKQIGAVWLPLPHLLNLLPVQSDVLYRTGLSGVAISVACFAAAAAALATLVYRTTRSSLGAVAAALVFASDPNVLYLQSTPMTESLLFALLVASVVSVAHWVESGDRHGVWRPGLVLALACMTRYEAWPVTAALLALTVVVLVRRGESVHASLRAVARITAWPFVAVLLFLVNSRVSTTRWFVTGGFFVPENDANGRPFVALAQVVNGVTDTSGVWTVAVGAIGLLLAVVWFAMDRRRSHALLSLALLATASLPFYAFVHGHPFRVRYMVVLVLAMAVGCGFSVAALKKWPLQLVAVAGLSMVGPPPLDPQAPMVVEAQWDRPASRARQAVTACLARDFNRPSDKILASMGSLAHYMQELAREGFRLDDFIHEGTDDFWPDTVDSPKRHVQWILFEEKSEGGDELTRRRQQFPELVDGFARVCEGGGVALYRRIARTDIELR